MLTHEERMALALELNKRIAAGGKAGLIATRDMIRADAITAEEISGLVDIYPNWATGVAYIIGDLVSYEGNLYQCVQAHAGQADWTPDVVPALFTRKTPAGIVPGWIQPTGAQDAYQSGDRVMFEGHVYESLIDANVWSPTNYPAGWQMIS